MALDGQYRANSEASLSFKCQTVIAKAGNTDLYY